MSDTDPSDDPVESFADAYLDAIRTAGSVETGVEQANAYVQRRFAAAICGESIDPRTDAGEELAAFELGPDARVDSHTIGQAMESVVTQLHGSMGAFYTPEEITSFMSERTIQPRMFDALGVDPDAVDDVDAWIETATRKQREDALEELQSMKLCDPACGSGHFLVTALDELVDLKLALHDALGNDVPAWRVAKRTAENNIYGVDLADEAVSVAKLRLRLSVLERLPPKLAAQYTGTTASEVAVT